MNRRPHATPRTPISLRATTGALLLGVFFSGAFQRVTHAAPRGTGERTHELIDTTLESHDVRLLGWDSKIVTVIGDDGIRREEPLTGVLTVLRTTPEQRWRRPSPDELAGGTAVVIELVDGQRFIGSVGPWDSEEIAERARSEITLAPDRDAVALLSASPNTSIREAGIDAVPLESIGRVLFDPWATGLAEVPNDERGVEDELVFTNGDRLSGFLVSLDGAVRFDAGDGEREFRLDRVAQLRLGNPSIQATGPRLWLSTGEIRNGLVPPALTGHAAASSDAIHAGWFADDTPIALTDLAGSEAIPGPGRRWTRPPRFGSAWSSSLGIPDVELDGPMSISFRLPPGASAFSAIAVLGGSLGHPAASPGPWADAEVRIAIRSAGEEITVAEQHLSGATSRAPIACPLPGIGEPDRVLVIEVLEGAHGPIQDRVLLRRPFLLAR